VAHVVAVDVGVVVGVVVVVDLSRFRVLSRSLSNGPATQPPAKKGIFADTKDFMNNYGRYDLVLYLLLLLSAALSCGVL
jgi:hypothetical protein